MDDLESLAQIRTRLEKLERRVAALELTSQAELPIQAATPQRGHSTAPNHLFPQPAGLFPIVGKAVLGIAGAYVLRAVAESNAVPELAVVVLALVYGSAWLVGATRTLVPAARATYAITAALILAPMLGELTLRFRILPSSVTAVLLGAFVLASAALAWKRRISVVIWVGVITGVCSTLVLLILSHDPVPYLTVLLLIAAVGEFSAAAKRWLFLRVSVAPALDLALLNFIYIFSLPAGSRTAYPEVGKPALLALPSFLLIMYGTSIAFRTMALRQAITVFEIMQAAIAFSLVALAWCWFGAGAEIAGFGVVCWLLAAACYAAAVQCFNRLELRNYRVYAAWSAALVLAGSFLILPPHLASVVLGAFAVLSILIGASVGRLMPGYQGCAYLAAAAVVSGLLGYIVSVMAGALPRASAWTIWVVAVCAIFCYGFADRFQRERWNQRLLHFLLALLAVSAVAAVLVSMLLRMLATEMDSHIAVVRTVIVCVLALSLAYSGRAWGRIELIWTAYLALAFVAAKLLLRDLRHEGSGTIAISLSVYALALIIVPRLGRRAQRSERFAGNEGKRNTDSVTSQEKTTQKATG